MKKLFLIFFLFAPEIVSAQWVQITMPTASDIVSSSFITDNEGWVGIKNLLNGAVVIYHTSDTGNTWTPDTIHDASAGSSYIQFVSSATGYAVVNGEAFKTTDGGSSWIQLSLPGIPYYQPCFLNEDTGIMIGDEQLFRTSDGGQTWNTFITDNYHFHELHFLNALEGIGCEYDGYLYATSDGGQNWFTVNDGGLWSYFYSACYTPDEEIYYTGYTDVFGDVTVDIYGPSDYYSSYEVGNLYDIKAYSDEKIYTAGENGDMVYSEDGGNSWIDFNLPELLGLSHKTLLTLDGFNVLYAFGEGGRGYRNAAGCVLLSEYSYTTDELQVQFTDLTAGATSWLWTFGDGTTSNQQNPLHTFSDDGHYHVCLVADNSCPGYADCKDVFVCGSNQSASISGSLDTSFSDDGIYMDYLDAYDGFCEALAIQSDHKILAASSGYNASLIRLNDDGTPDSSFSNDGIIQISSNTYDMKLTPDEKVLVMGLDASSSIFLNRFNPDGTVDPGFGSNGMATVTPFGSSNITSFFVEDNGKIIIADKYNLAGSSMHIIRLNADASLDSSFSGDGIADIPSDNIFFFNAEFGSLIGLNSGKVAIAATSLNTNDDFAIVRLNGDGSMDTTFSNDGVAITNFFGQSKDYPTCLAEQADGKIIVAGISDTDAGIVRYNVNGTLDGSFGNSGKLTFNLNDKTTSATAVTIQSDGKILVTGQMYNDGLDKIFVARFNTDGSFDPGFGNDGFIKTGWNCTQSRGKDIAIDGDKIYVGGGLDGLSYGAFAVIRYNNPCMPGIADFNITATDLTVQFSDESTGANTWFWDFGDGSTDISQNPSHTYLAPGTYNVCLIAGNDCSSDTICQTVDIIATAGQQFPLDNLHLMIAPNPFTDFTTINFSLAQNSVVAIDLFDLQGKKMETLSRGNYLKGDHSLILSSKDFIPGIYFLRLQTDQRSLMRKIIIE